MAIFERIADILKANVNDLIDKAEDPEKMVKQLIIEMEEQVEEATRSLGQAMGSQKVAAKELSDAMAEAALRDGCTATNPRIPMKPDIIEIYKKIW